MVRIVYKIMEEMVDRFCKEAATTNVGSKAFSK
ncbi:hypothetical protein SDC9_87111 [bioreactor metagenome]|uniref:Uncharacterized protein n=1 Tax=bioreactor metagenome TaxID=1076179 RepID=A0A644ZIB4_9ZZZZ